MHLKPFEEKWKEAVSRKHNELEGENFSTFKVMETLVALWVDRKG